MFSYPTLEVVSVTSSGSGGPIKVAEFSILDAPSGYAVAVTEQNKIMLQRPYAERRIGQFLAACKRVPEIDQHWISPPVLMLTI